MYIYYHCYLCYIVSVIIYCILIRHSSKTSPWWFLVAPVASSRVPASAAAQGPTMWKGRQAAWARPRITWSFDQWLWYATICCGCCPPKWVDCRWKEKVSALWTSRSQMPWWIPPAPDSETMAECLETSWLICHSEELGGFGPESGAQIETPQIQWWADPVESSHKYPFFWLPKALQSSGASGNLGCLRHLWASTPDW